MLVKILMLIERRFIENRIRRNINEMHFLFVFICDRVGFVVEQTDSLCSALSRKKTDSDEGGKEKLKRVLTLFDLTALGTGSTLGCGVYVLAGAVAKSIAGPAVVLSFAIAAVVSAFSGKY